MPMTQHSQHTTCQPNWNLVSHFCPTSSSCETDINIEMRFKNQRQRSFCYFCTISYLFSNYLEQARQVSK